MIDTNHKTALDNLIKAIQSHIDSTKLADVSDINKDKQEIKPVDRLPLWNEIKDKDKR